MYELEEDGGFGVQDDSHSYIWGRPLGLGHAASLNRADSLNRSSCMNKNSAHHFIDGQRSMLKCEYDGC